MSALTCVVGCHIHHDSMVETSIAASLLMGASRGCAACVTHQLLAVRCHVMFTTRHQMHIAAAAAAAVICSLAAAATTLALCLPPPPRRCSGPASVHTHCKR